MFKCTHAVHRADAQMLFTQRYTTNDDNNTLYINNIIGKEHFWKQQAKLSRLISFPQSPFCISAFYLIKRVVFKTLFNIVDQKVINVLPRAFHFKSTWANMEMVKQQVRVLCMFGSGGKKRMRSDIKAVCLKLKRKDPKIALFFWTSLNERTWWGGITDKCQSVIGIRRKATSSKHCFCVRPKLLALFVCLITPAVTSVTGWFITELFMARHLHQPRGCHQPSIILKLTSLKVKTL